MPTRPSRRTRTRPAIALALALPLAPGAEARAADLLEALVRKRITPALRARMAMSGMPASAMPRARRPRRVRAVTPPAAGPS